MAEVASGAEESLRFAILGRVRGWRGEQELDLGPGKQRAVLAVLLLNANRPTSTSAIVDAVWGDDPPENGANVVQKYVAGLRRVLEPDRTLRTPWRTLTLTDAGYTLHVEPGGLDADDFRRRLERAREERALDRPAEAAERLREALALWHEPALAGLRGPVFDAARDRLDEARASALEESVELELDLGRHDRLIPELVELIAEYPMRERLRYLLILALYRSGRQAEALAAFRDTRTFLNEEFGVEPGERLQQLHLSILRADPTLAATPSTPSPAQNSAGRPSAPHSDSDAAESDSPGPAERAEPTEPPVQAPVRGAVQADERAPSAPATPAEDIPRPAPPDPETWPTAPPAAAGPAWEPASWPPTPVPVPPFVPPFALRDRPRWPNLLAVLAISLFTCGFGIWLVITYFAARRKSWILGVAAIAYILIMIGGFAAVGSSPEDDTKVIRDDVGIVVMLACLVVGTTHAALLVYWPQPRRRIGHSDPETLAALERRVRREQAHSILRHHPAVAYELDIGRPDRPRAFDDGGLVDINAVSEAVLAALPGVTGHQARQIVADRRIRGPFTAVEDLMARDLLAAPIVQMLRDTLIVMPAVIPPEAGLRPAPSGAAAASRAEDEVPDAISRWAPGGTG